jgi:hypothetical protein
MSARTLVQLERHTRSLPGGPPDSTPCGLDTRVRHCCRAACAPGSSVTGAFARDRKLALLARQASRQDNRPPVQHKELYTGYQPYRSPQAEIVHLLNLLYNKIKRGLSIPSRAPWRTRATSPLRRLARHLLEKGRTTLHQRPRRATALLSKKRLRPEVPQ